MRKWFWILLLVLLNCAMASKAQNATIDSLKQTVDTMTQSKAKVETLLEISVQLYSGKASKNYAFKAIEEASLLKDEILLAHCYSNLATIYRIEFQIDSFNTYSSLAEEKYKALNDNWGLASIYRSRATVFTNFKQPQSALENFEKALDFSQKAKHPESIINTLNNWGVFYFKNGKYNASIEKLEEGLKVYEAAALSRSDMISRLEFNLGRSMRAAQRYAPALIYLKEAYLKRKELNLVGGIGESLQQFLEVWLDLKTNNRDTSNFRNTINDLGFNNSFDLLDSLKQLANSNNHNGVKNMYLKTSSRMYESIGNHQLALQNYKRLKHLEDSLILGKQNLKAVADITIKYNNEVLQNQLLQSKIVETERTNQRNLLLFALLASFLLTGIGGLYFKQKITTNKIALELEAQKLKDLKKQQQLLAMNAMLQGQEKERERIAKDLHDGLGNMLTSIKFQIAKLTLSLNSSEHLKSATDNLIDEACSEVRKIAHNMMPRALKQLGLKNALSDLCERQDANHAYSVFFQSFGKEVQLSSNTETTLYRIAQEVFNNINKHASANEVVVQMTFSEEWLNLNFEDDGQGFDRQNVVQKTGLGLDSIQSRATYLSGECLIDSRPGKGTSISINIPINKETLTEV